MERVPEPEVMDDEQQVVAYARADFTASNRWYVSRLLERHAEQLDRVVDLGCGPGGVDVELATACPVAHITAVDASAPMIEEARRRMAAAGCADRVTLLRGYLPGADLDEGTFSAVISKDMLHHLPDPAVLWQEALRLGQPGAILCVMDLVRPRTAVDARAIVESVAAEEDPVLKADFFNSLCAAFTPDEVRSQARDAGLVVTVTPAGDRHMLVTGTLP